MTDKAKPTLYALLNRHAKAWWYHAELRATGHRIEARKRERDSIRSDINLLRAVLAVPGGHCGLGRGGASLYAKDRTLSGGANDYYREVARLLGIPLIDSTTVPDKAIWETVSFPMVAVGRAPDPGPWHGFSYAPLDYVAGLYLALGATVENLKIDPVTANRDLALLRERREVIRAENAAKPKPEPVKKPTVTAEGQTIDLQDLEDEGADGACLACGEYAYGIEPDAHDYECESCGRAKVMGAENILLIYA